VGIGLYRERGRGRGSAGVSIVVQRGEMLMKREPSIRKMTVKNGMIER